MKKSCLMLSKTLVLSASLATPLLANQPESVPSSTKETEELKKQIADMQAQMEVMMKRLNELSNTTIKTPEIVAQNDTQPLPEPKAEKKGGDKVKLAIYGHVNRAVALYDNGHEREIKHVDNNSSSSRLRFNGEGKLNESFKAGGTIEYEIISENSASVDIKQNQSSASSSSFRDRIIEGYFDTKWGKLSLGQGETASHRIAHSDLTGTGVIQEGIELDTQAGGVRFARYDEVKPLPNLK